MRVREIAALVLCAFVIVFAVYKVGANSKDDTAALVQKAKYEQDVATWHERINACNRGKRDRADNAAGWKAHEIYITKVTGAKSVKEDVKTAARSAVVVYRLIADDLESRTGDNLNCVTVNQKPETPEGVTPLP